MRHPMLLLIISMAVLFTAGCGFHLRGNTQVPQEMKKLVVSSSDPYGPLARTVRQQLRLNDITIIDNPGLRTDLPTLRLLNDSLGRDTASVFQNGVTAEYSMVLTASAQVLLPGKGIYPISATVYRSFFDNPMTPLAKDSEQDIIIQEMRERAADQLVRNLLSVHAAEAHHKKLPAEADAMPTNKPISASAIAPHQQ